MYEVCNGRSPMVVLLACISTIGIKSNDSLLKHTTVGTWKIAKITGPSFITGTEE